MEQLNFEQLARIWNALYSERAMYARGFQDEKAKQVAREHTRLMDTIERIQQDMGKGGTAEIRISTEIRY